MIGPFLCDQAWVWSGPFAIDADGSPRAYALPDRFDLAPLDSIRNAMTASGRYVGVACDVNGEPYVQGEGDPCPGYLVSQTALEVPGYADQDPRKYINSEEVPYVSIPPELHRKGVKLADVAMVVHDGICCGAVVADIGPSEHYGEGSIALADALGIPSSPRTGGVSSGVSVVIWPGSRRGWPRPVEDFQRQAREAFADWGGIDKLQQSIAAWTQP